MLRCICIYMRVYMYMRDMRVALGALTLRCCGSGSVPGTVPVAARGVARSASHGTAGDVSTHGAWCATVEVCCTNGAVARLTFVVTVVVCGN